MAEVLFAEDLRAAGHTVHTPDLFEGRTFGAMDEGVNHAREIGFGEVLEHGVRAADELPARRAALLNERVLAFLSAQR